MQGRSVLGWPGGHLVLRLQDLSNPCSQHHPTPCNLHPRGLLQAISLDYFYLVLARIDKSQVKMCIALINMLITRTGISRRPALS